MKKTVSHVMILTLTMAGLAQAATITVGPGAAYDFATIQAGIDAAIDGDTVLVAPGEYVITEPITFRGKAIAVRSEVGRDETTIRMGTPTDPKRASVVIFENSETDASILEGFTITRGKGSSVPTLSNLYGGGILFNASSAKVENCAIVQNRPVGSGGGVFCAYPCSPVIINCLIAENSAGVSGGGVFPWSGASMTMTDCTIRENSAGVAGGGVSCERNASMTLTNCIIAQNSSTTLCGGGLLCFDSSYMTMTYCTISDNSAATLGGGLMCGENSSSVTMTHCEIVGNTAGFGGGGLIAYHQTSVTVTNCVIAQNTAVLGGGGIVSYGPTGCSMTVTNSILWGNDAPQGRQIRVKNGGTLNIAYSNVAGDQSGVSIEGSINLNWDESNIDVEPCFADPANNDYHLKSQAGRWDPCSQTWVQDDVTSPCIDAGDPMSPIGWEPFPNGGYVNMGVYGNTFKASKTYFGEPLCETIFAGDINGDGQVNRADLEIMALHWTDDEPLPLP